MGLFLLLLLAVFWLAWSNGANDNFKGVATLYGSNTADYRTALTWATVTTLLGSLVSIVFAATLVKAFSGKGLVPDELLGPPLLLAVGAAGALTILLATWLGMPTSTTHALTGALVGVALAGAGPAGVDWHVLGTKFAQPLLLSPLLAIGLTAVVYPLAHRMRIGMGVERTSCVCVGPEPAFVPVAALAGFGGAVATPAERLTITAGDSVTCVERYQGRLLAVDAQAAVNVVHYASGGAVCFARAVNDTPKIAALLLAAAGTAGMPSLGTTGSLVLVAAAMAVGGWLQSRKVAETMSRRITDLNPGQGLTANLVTSLLVLGASRLGVPVSTTHVSCGTIFGIGLSSGTRDWKTIGQILLAWVTTLPLGLVLGALIYLGVQAAQ